jgi:type I restriction enzyme S subunit
MPSRSEQVKIGELYLQLSEKIEINHRINTELEGMAKLLYDYWFVQYDFPLSAAQAAALGQPRLTGQPYRSSGGPMVFDPQLKREIPVIWSADNLLQLSELGGGGTPNTKNQEYWSGHIPFFTPTDAEPQPFKLTTEQKITLKGLENSSTKVYPKGTLFVTARGSVGKIMIIASDMAMNQSCYALCPHEGVNTPFLYFHALSLVNFLRTKSSGSIFKSIVTNDIKFSTTVIPDLETIESFGKIAEPLFSQILNNQQQNQELTTLRDWLLPMLMNGQVRVG